MLGEELREVGVLQLIGGLIVLILICGCIPASRDLFRSAIRPKPEDHLLWYDRVLRAIGGLILLAVFIGFMVALVKRER